MTSYPIVLHCIGIAVGEEGTSCTALSCTDDGAPHGAERAARVVQARHAGLQRREHHQHDDQLPRRDGILRHHPPLQTRPHVSELVSVFTTSSTPFCLVYARINILWFMLSY